MIPWGIFCLTAPERSAPGCLSMQKGSFRHSQYLAGLYASWHLYAAQFYQVAPFLLIKRLSCAECSFPPRGALLIPLYKVMPANNGAEVQDVCGMLCCH
ncbi:hypothetical protein XENTR_v10004259 [Xenopus tropicalis]|nr:hypothetical protein XENTR_v10004259 [Xenopus tropicalis]